MRSLLLIAIGFLLATFAPLALQRPQPVPKVTQVIFEPVPFDLSWPGRARIGGLRWLVGWALRSNDPRFGGISAMHVEGREVTAFSDTGWLIRFPLPGMTGTAEIRALPRGPGSSGAKAQRDIESMAVEGRNVWAGFEGRNAVWRFERPSWRATAGVAPFAMRRWSFNTGAEAMLRLPDGRFLVFSEGKGHGGEVLLFDGDAAIPGTPVSALRYIPPDGYRVTDAALLPDGRALLLNRRFTLLEGMTAKLTVVPLSAFQPGAEVRGTEIADLRRPVTVDNMEALSVTREGGRTIVWLASDDNYLPLQRTLLLKFALEE
jgi:hypothetical protein